MKKHFLFLSLVFIVAFFNSCQKEFSFENGGVASEGSLQSDTGGDCLPKTVAGVYEAGTAVDPTTEYIEVQVNVISGGSYTIYSDTLNGVYFRATGVFTTTGLTTVRLKATGTPISQGINNYVITYGATQCSIAVTTLPAGGASPAVFTLSGAPGACMGFVLSGTYTAGVMLGASNSVDITIDVTTIGTYTITTPASNGISFSGTGALINTGVQTITLAGNGTPVTAGTTNISVTAGTSSCSFPINVVGPAVYTVNCGTANVNGTYTQNVALDGSNTVNIDVDVTSIGGYTITGTINGMTFSNTGNFTATGTQTITLAGSGMPTAAGNFNVPLTGGTAPCSFPVTVVAGAAIDWKFNVTGIATPFQGTLDVATLQSVTLPPPASITVADFVYSGVTSTGETLDFELLDLSGTIQNNETYSSASTGATNAAAIDYVGSGTTEYFADPSTAGVTMIFKVTNINTTTKTISGTFSGTALDENNAVKTITNGTFQGTYQ